MDTAEKKILVEQWYRQYSKLLFHAACLLDNPGAAEELVQETFRIVMELDNLNQIEYPKTWLRKILYNVVRNRRRKQQNIASISIDSENFSSEETGSYENELNLELEYGGIVSTEDFRLLQLSILEGHTYAEISEELGISAKACQKRAERAKKKIRKALKANNKKK